jgi:hypothetical protein
MQKLLTARLPFELLLIICGILLLIVIIIRREKISKQFSRLYLLMFLFAAVSIIFVGIFGMIIEVRRITP